MVFENIKVAFSETVLKSLSALILLVIGLVLGRVSGRLIARILKELNISKFIKKKLVDYPIEQIIGELIKYLIYIISIVTALSQIGLSDIVVKTIITLIIFFILIFILLGIKDFITNLIAGFIIKRKNLANTDDFINLDKIQGKVIASDFHHVKIRTSSNDIIYIPNSLFMRKILIKK